jgi:chromosome segregation ATPase
VPQPSGTIGSQDFAPSRTEAYNSAVTELQRIADRTAKEIADRQRAAEEAQRAAAARDAINKALDTVRADVNRLGGASDRINQALAPVTSHVQKARTDLDETKADFQKTEASKVGPACQSNAKRVHADANRVKSDFYSVQADQQGLKAAIGDVDSWIASTDKDFQALQAALSALPHYQPAGLVTQADVDAVERTARDAQAQGNQSMTSAVEEVRAMLAAANGYAATASRTCGR